MLFPYVLVMLLFQVEVIKLRHPMIDCHCHLADEQFADDIDEVVDRARRAGVAATLVCSEFSEQFADVINLSKRFPGFCFPCIGIHPIQVCVNRRSNIKAYCSSAGLSATFIILST